MAYDTELADRLRVVLQGEEGLEVKPMFGGLAFLINGSVAVCASSQGGLLLRIDPEEGESHIGEPFVEHHVMHGRVMEGWLQIDLEGVAKDDDLKRWAAAGVRHARSIPAKKPARSK